MLAQEIDAGSDKEKEIDNMISGEQKRTGEEENSEFSDDPFNLYPLIDKENIRVSKIRRKKKVMSLGNLIKVSEQGSLTQHSASRVSRCESGEDRSEGVVRKIKRGRKTQSRAESSGIGKVILEGGTMLEDAEIVACNQLLFRSQEAEA